ncbi:MAG: response regulator transcription factor [Chitinophagaceae bacterium]
MIDTTAKILLVEDDPTLAFVVKDKLEQSGYEVVYAADGEGAWIQFMKHNFDMCVLDVMLPRKDGLWLASQIRLKNDSIPILLLTSKSMDEDKITGFKSGADDYITKPFNIQELLLRIEVFLKRTQKAKEKGPDNLKIGNYIFDYSNMLLVSDTERKQLTQREADLLYYLVLNPNKVLKREEILKEVWGKEDYFLGRSMDVFITKIRKYLKDQPGVELETIHGIGFRFINKAS